MIVVTGGAGFIGSNFILSWLKSHEEVVINLDKLTYASSISNLSKVSNDERYIFEKGDIADKSLVSRLLEKYKPRFIINFAAESHVDRSIRDPAVFVQTNIVGTFNLLHCLLSFSSSEPSFKFLHISTDEVYGSLGKDDSPFQESHKYQPNSPYSASKASSDHLVRAFHKTYGLPVLVTNCSNNYGPRQYLEKFIPLVICNAIQRKQIPIYGDGSQIRDWLYVEDHCSALERVLSSGEIGETYNIGGWNELTNINVVKTICQILDEKVPLSRGSYQDQIAFVDDRPGHDKRYAIDASKIEKELGWTPREDFWSGISKTIEWYLTNQEWVKNVAGAEYQKWTKQQYA